ncbi:hypothetical protein FB451DRAFT_431674 [Mycena latifolia]|nr:hypothetical protein FB451DRAFT_431674 [Mycena latifolia]
MYLRLGPCTLHNKDDPSSMSKPLHATTLEDRAAARPDMPVNTNPARARLLAVQERLDDTDAEIAGTLAHLQRLELRRRDILVDLNAVSSPILNLPPELVCEIFLHCLPPPGTPPSPRDAPLLLAQVCGQWRGIALSLPTLWTSVCAAVSVSLAPNDELLSAMLDLWLERAGNCTLSVSMVLDNPAIPALPMLGPPRSAVFRKLRHASHRWRELTLVRRLEDFPVLLHRDAPWNLPELVKLTLLLSHGGRHPTAYPPDLLSNLLDAPALREVHLMGFTPTSLLLPWSQLTTARVEHLLPLELLHTLAHTTNLEHGTFSLWPTQFFHLTATAPAVRLPRLKSLTISGELCTALLPHLDALPALTRFALSFGAHNDFAPLAEFLVRFPNIKDVDLDARAAVSAGDLLSVLDALPTVETLALGAHNGLLNGLLPAALHAPSALPCLRALVVRERVDRYHEPPLDDLAVLHMLRQRWAAGLQRFTLVTTHVFRAVHPGFSALAREGMQIELRTHGSGPFLVVYFDSRRGLF